MGELRAQGWLCTALKTKFYSDVSNYSRSTVFPSSSQFSACSLTILNISETGVPAFLVAPEVYFD